MKDKSLPLKDSDSEDPKRQEGINGGDDDASHGAVEADVDEPSDRSNSTRRRANAEAILLPDKDSILFGRGKSCNNHAGNKKMRRIINQYKQQYQTSMRGEKYKLVRRVYGELVDEGLKFLKPSEGQDGWVEVGVEAAIQKVGHALRNQRGEKTERAGKPRARVDEGISGASAKPAASESSSNRIASHIAAQQHLAGEISGLASLSLPFGSGIPRSIGLAQGSAGGLLENAAASIGALQDHLAASQRLSSLSALMGASFQNGNSLLPLGTPGADANSMLNPLLSLENYRRDLDLQRLQAALSIGGSLTLPGGLPALSADPFYALAEREYQIRQLLLNQQLSRSTGSTSEQSEEGKQGNSHNNGSHH